MLSRTPPSMLDCEEKPYKYRLESIGQAMSWIKGELATLKESDKSLTEIFRKLQTDIQEIGEMCNDARHSFRTSRYGAFAVEHPANQDLELSFEDSVDQEESPVLTAAPHMTATMALPVPQHQLTTSLSANDSLNSGSPQHKLKFSPSTSGKESPVLTAAPHMIATMALPVPQHQLTTSLSANDSLNSGSPQHKLKSSPSTSGNSYNGLEVIDGISSVSNQHMSRYSSVDSGIQFTNEPEVAPSNASSSLFDEIFNKLGWQQGMAN